MGMSRRPLHRLLAVLAVLTGCRVSDSSPSTFTVVDSAGVRVVHSTGPRLSGAARLDGLPLVVLGRAAGDAESQFYRVQAVRILPGGGVLVADGGSRELRRFDASGRLLWTFGGPGEGPGQFGQLTFLALDAAGRSWLWDRRLLRITVVDSGGESDETIRAPGGTAPVIYGKLRNGSYLAAFPTPLPPPRPGTLLADTIRLALLDSSLQDPRPVTALPGPLWLWTGQYQLPVPLTANPLKAVVGASVLTASGAVPQVSVHDSSGALKARYHLPSKAMEVSPGELRHRVESWVAEGIYPGTLAVWREWFERMPLPAEPPAFDRLVTGHDGSIWVRRYQLDPEALSTWEILDPDGPQRITLATDGSLEIMDVRDDVVAVVVRDSLDVESVALYRLQLAS